MKQIVFPGKALHKLLLGLIRLLEELPGGVGDLAGIRERLDHLSMLGVDGVWLTPFYPSPQADGGYDVADYTDVHPIFGTPGSGAMPRSWS